MILRVQFGRTTFWPSLVRWPWCWDYERSLMGPRLMGFGIWIEEK